MSSGTGAKKAKKIQAMAVLGGSVLLAGLLPYTKSFQPQPWQKDVLLFDYATNQEVSLSASAGTTKRIALCFFCDCDNCHRSAAALSRKLRPATMVAAVNMPPEAVADFRQATNWHGRILFDAMSQVRDRYEGEHCPHVVVLNERGQPVLVTSERDVELRAATVQAISDAVNSQ